MSSELNRLIRNAEAIDLTDDDIVNICRGDVDIYSYEDLAKFNSSNDLFKNSNNAMILYTTHDNFGHWSLLMKRGENLLEFFDSYGYGVDEAVKFIRQHHTRVHHDNILYHLTYLIEQSGSKVISNKKRLQKQAKDIETCGRWTSLRVRFSHLSNERFNKIFGPNGDYVVTMMTILFSGEKLIK